MFQPINPLVFGVGWIQGSRLQQQCICVCGVCVCVNGRRLIHYQRPFCQACESIFFLPLFFPPFSLSLLDCSMSSLIETTNKEEVPVSAVQPISGMIVRALLLFRSC